MKPIIGRAALAYLFLALANIAYAGEVPYNKTQFDEQIAAGKPTVVYLHAAWCPTCKIQQPIVDRLSSELNLNR